MNEMMKNNLIFLLCFLSVVVSHAQEQADVCENRIPPGWTTAQGRLSVSNCHFKLGSQSIQWQWKKAGALLRIRDMAFRAVAGHSRSTFVVWVYNERPVNDRLRFTFKKDEQTACWFMVSLNFTGWRTAWVMYHRDMQGKPLEGMNSLVIQAPPGAQSGAVYFDQMLYQADINPRSPMQDEMVPFVNVHAAEAANAHWTALYRFSKNAHYLPLPSRVTPAERNDIDTVTARYRRFLLSAFEKKLPDSISIEKEFRYWNIARDGKGIRGRPVYNVNDIELASETPDAKLKELNALSSIKRYSEWMLQVAAAYCYSASEKTKERYGQLFLDLLDHLEDQGWTAGSGMGALHHLGYNFKDYYSACLLMKEFLLQSGKWKRTWQSMSWFCGLGRTRVKPEKVYDSNIDVFNTLLGSMLSTVLMMTDARAQVQQLHEFSNWLSRSIAPTYAIDGTFKPDGSVFHHGNLYPAYGIGGFQGIAPVVYMLGKTSFKISAGAHQNLKNVLQMMHYYTNPLYWPLSVSGRHPTGNWKIAGEAYAYMALAGSPDGRQAIDTGMAAVYLKINTDKKDRWVQQFTNAAIKPAAYPNGHWDLNYGLLTIHRRQNWLVTVRAHNRYFTTHEAYPGANMYGRYLTYGNLQVLFPQTPANRGSNFKDEGWDWNCIPGTTTLYLPLEKLRASIVNADDYSGMEEMLLSDEIFAGGTGFEGQGMFAMKLHGHSKYDMDSFRAIKSWFMFDSLVICLGSDISNSRGEYPVVTTVFQNSLDEPDGVFYINGDPVKSFPFEAKWKPSDTVTIIDNRKIGYYLPGQEKPAFSKKVQFSKNQQDNRDTRGNMATLLIDHGKAPQGQRYQYAMLINTGIGQMNELKSAMQSKKPVYKILQQNSEAHALWYEPLQITAAALFAAHAKTGNKLVLSNSRPCLIMYQQRPDTVSLSVTDPDLAFYKGPDDSPRDSEGKRKEVSIYSRDWYKAPSQPSVVTLIIKGSWKVVAPANGIKYKLLANQDTELSIRCRYGLASRVQLVKEKEKGELKRHFTGVKKRS